MSAGILSFDILFTLCVAYYFVWYYDDKRTRWPAKIAVFVTWWLSLVIIFILPLDVSSTFYLNCLREWYCDDKSPTPPGCVKEGLQVSNITAMCDAAPDCTCEEPYSFVAKDTYRLFWMFVFWSSQLLTWIVLPLMSSYLDSGDFTVMARLKSAVKENTVIYASAGVLLAVFFLYIAIKNNLSLSGLEQVVIAASNTWGLVMLIALLGYGLVDVPRWLWQRYDEKNALRVCYFRVAKLNSEMAEAKEKLLSIEEEVKTAAGAIGPREELRHYIEEIMRKCSSGYNAETDTYDDYRPTGKSKKEVVMYDLKAMVSLHARLIRAQRILYRIECQWEHIVERAYRAEDLKKNREKEDRRYIPIDGKAYTGYFSNIQPSVKWYWKVMIRPYFFLLWAIVGSIMSLCLVWSEVLFWKENPVLSVYALLMKVPSSQQQYFQIELLTFITIFYMCMCAYRVIFQIRAFSHYYLVPHQKTDSHSLLFSALFFSRLISPLCLNYLSLAHLDSEVTNTHLDLPTGFTQIMGHMSVVSFISDFNVYFPILVIIISLSTVFKVGNRIMSLFGIQTFIDDDEAVEEFISEGRTLVTREKRRRQRTDRESSTARLRAGDDDPESGSGVTPAPVSAPAPARTSTRTSGRVHINLPSAEPVEFEEYEPGTSSLSKAKGKPSKPASKLDLSGPARGGRVPTSAAAADVAPTTTTTAPAASRWGIGSLFNGFKAAAAATTRPARSAYGNLGLDDEEELLPMSEEAPRANRSRPSRNLFDDI